MDRKGFISLKVKLTIGVIFVCALVGLVAIASVNRIASDIVDKEYKDKAEQIAEAVVTTIDPADVSNLKDAVMEAYRGIDNVVPSSEWGSDAWNEYMSNYDGIEELPVFLKLRDHFRVYQDIYDVDCIYVMYYKTSVKHAIYIVDGAYEDACPPGVVDSFDDGIWPEEDAPEVIPATITNEDVYGWLATACYPVVDENGALVAHLCVDISMNDVKAKERSYVISTILSISGLTVLILILALLFVGHSVITPVQKLSYTAENYCAENNDVVHHAFEELEIKSHDEIGHLLFSMKQMEKDMNTNINALIDAKVALKETEEKANSMQELATKDALTGIRNKMAYDHEQKKLEKDLEDGFDEFGLAMIDLNYLKKINDTYGHEKGNISIRRLCMAVCEVFEHSPVFRIGGDEFIVVLKFRAYKNVDTLVAQFNERLENTRNDDTLKPWEQLSAAIGYHKFDKTEDKTVDDVFRKADKAMYDMKVSMKAQRTD